MTPDRKKSGMAFWATAMVVVVLVAYALSIGPACWISSRMNYGADAVSFVYQPIRRILRPDPWQTRNNKVQILIGRYIRLWAEPEWTWDYSE
jgi:hypothetical protein